MFKQAIIAAAKAHAVAEWPRESCGLVTPEGYVACRNVSATPLGDFEIAPEDLIAAEVLGVLHSHPCTDKRILLREPSAADMRGQMASGVPWGIIQSKSGWASEPLWFGDALPIPPLLGREFINGVTDCYSLIRDAYRFGKAGMKKQGMPGWPWKKIALPDFPRDYAWEHDGGSLYLDNFAAAGFTRIAEAQVRVGDVFLAQIRTPRNNPTPNHGGIYIGDGLILQHLARKLSARDVAARWRPFITHWLRFQG